jgi:hypothetical protein
MGSASSSASNPTDAERAARFRRASLSKETTVTDPSEDMESRATLELEDDDIAKFRAIRIASSRIAAEKAATDVQAGSAPSSQIRDVLATRHLRRAAELGIAGDMGGDLGALYADLPMRPPPGESSGDGGSGAAAASSRPLRLMQWNLLADGLSKDGFLVDPVVNDWPVAPGQVPTNRAVAVGAAVGAWPMVGASKSEMLRDIVAASQASEGERDEALLRVQHDYSTAASQRNVAAVVDFEGRLLRMLYMISALDPDVITVQELDRMGIVAPALFALGYVCGSGAGDAGGGGNSQDAPSYTPLLSTTPAVTADGYLAALQEAGIAFAPTLGSTTHKVSLARWASKLAGLTNVPYSKANPGPTAFMEAFRQMGADPSLIPTGGDAGAPMGPTLARLLEDPFVIKNGGLGPALLLAGATEEDVLGVDNDGPAIFWKASRYVGLCVWGISRTHCLCVCNALSVFSRLFLTRLGGILSIVLPPQHQPFGVHV